MLEQKLEHKFKQLMKKMEKSRKWNSYMTDDLRRAERDCLELIEDEPSRQAVHAELEKARKIIETYHDKAKKAKLKADAAAAYKKLESMSKHMGTTIGYTDYMTPVANSLVLRRLASKQYVESLTRAYATAVGDTKPPRKTAVFGRRLILH